MIRALSMPLAGWPLYLALAIAATWPLAGRLDTELVLGTEVARTVPQFNAWTIWWNVDRASHGFRGYWDAPIFHPTVNTFALSEPQPITILMAPIFWLTGSVLATANLYLLVTLLLNGWLAELFAVGLGLRRGIAIGAGAAVVLLPIVHWQMGVMQLVGLWPSLWTLLEFQRAFAAGPSSRCAPRGGWLDGVRLGIAYSAALWTCVHHALFLALLLLLCAPAVLPGIVCRRPGRRAATAALLCCGLLSGWLLLRLWQMPVDKPRRPLELITQLSLIPGDYLAVYGHTWLAPGQAWTRAGWFVSPGVLKVMLAAVGLVWGWSARPRRRWTLWLASFFLASLLLSFGTRLDLWGWRPWLWIADWVPGFGQVRNVFRFAYFTQLTVVLLAAAGVEGAWNWLRSVTLPPAAPHDPVRHADSPPRPASQPADTHSVARWRTVTAWSVALIGVIAVFDPWPPRPQLTLPGPLAMLQSGGEDWMSVLRRDAAAPAPADAVPRRAVVCLPMAVGNDVRDFAVSTDWMLAGTRHRLPMVNGYSGFFPQNYFYWRNRLQSEEPIDETVLANLYSIGVRWLVIDPRSYPADDAETFRLGSYALTQISAADQPIRIYRLSVLQ